MQTQIEAKFLAVEFEEIRDRLEELGAVLVDPMKLVRCAVIDYPDRRLKTDKSAWVRIRDEGDKATLTYKEVIEQRRGGTKQTELSVDSFDAAVELLEKLGLRVVSVQESRQEIWHLGAVQIIIEEWPWIRRFIEMAGPSEAAIRDASARLGLAWSQAVFGSTTLAYAAEFPGIRLDRGDAIIEIKEIKFGTALPGWLKERQVA